MKKKASSCENACFVFNEGCNFYPVSADSTVCALQQGSKGVVIGAPDGTVSEDAMLASALRSLPSPLQHYLLQATLIGLVTPEQSNTFQRATV